MVLFSGARGACAAWPQPPKVDNRERRLMGEGGIQIRILSALSLCDTQWCAQNWCGGAPKTTVSLLLNSGCRIYAGLAQRQSGAFVQRRSRFRNSHPAPEGDHAGRPGAYLNRGSIPQPEGPTPSGAGATEYAAFTRGRCYYRSMRPPQSRQKPEGFAVHHRNAVEPRKKLLNRC